jgi:hypothetical protein
LRAKSTFSAAQNVPKNTNRKRKSDTGIQKTLLFSTFPHNAGFDDLYKPNRKKRIRWLRMTCWKWFDGMLKEAGIKVTDKNKDKIDKVIHRYVGEQSSYGRCSADWRKARKEIQDDEAMKEELIEQLQTAM